MVEFNDVTNTAKGWWDSATARFGLPTVLFVVGFLTGAFFF